MLLRFYILVAAIPIVTYCFRQPRSAVWHHSGPEYHKDRKSDNSAWNERFVGHSNGYKVKRVEGHEKDDVGYAHAAAHESEQHALSKAASASKHAAAAAEKGSCFQNVLFWLRDDFVAEILKVTFSISLIHRWDDSLNRYCFSLFIDLFRDQRRFITANFVLHQYLTSLAHTW